MRLDVRALIDGAKRCICSALAPLQEVQYRLEAAFSMPGMGAPAVDVFAAAALLAAREGFAIQSLHSGWPLPSDPDVCHAS